MKTPSPGPMASLIEQFRSIAKTLVKYHALKHSQLKQELFDTIKQLSNELPTIQILYNDTYGGYGYSKDYERFKKNVKLPPSNINYNGIFASRVQEVKYIKEYGKYCKGKYPLVAQMIATYKSRDLGNIFWQVISVKNHETDLNNLQATLKTIIDTPDTSFGSESDVHYVYFHNFEIQKVEKYNKESLVLWCLQKKTEIAKELEDKICNIHTLLGKCADFIIKNYEVMFEEEKSQEEIPWYDKKKWHEKLSPKNGLRRKSFTEAIEDYGESHFAIWKCQLHYKEVVMRFLLKHPDVIPLESSNDCDDLDVGLLCASSAYCKLKIDDVPQLLDWSIGEYDGLEQVIIEP